MLRACGNGTAVSQAVGRYFPSAPVVIAGSAIAAKHAGNAAEWYKSKLLESATKHRKQGGGHIVAVSEAIESAKIGPR